MSKKSFNPKFYQTRDFRRLDKVWQSKLKESGFRDLEQSTLSEYSNLPPSVNIRTMRYKTMEETEKYYQNVREYLNEGFFKNDKEKKVWEFHSNGDSLMEISEKIDSSRSTIFYIVKKIKKRMMEG